MGNESSSLFACAAVCLRDFPKCVRSLGERAPGSYAEFAKLASIKEASGTPDSGTMIRQLVEGNEAAVKTARSIFDTADDAGDESTADLLTQRLQIHEKTAWMLRSVLE